MFEYNIKSYECNIQTLSPIHIGSGNKFNSSEFITLLAKDKKENKFHLIRRINFDKYYSSLSDEKKDEFLENITDLNFKLDDFDNKIKRDFRRYDSINQSSNKSPKEISEHIRTMDKLFIPGSSIKGVIKTALLYDNIEERDINKIHQLVRNGRNNKNYLNKKGWQDIENEIFSSQKGGKSAQYNISKFLQVSDSTTLSLGTIHESIAIKAKSNPWEGFEQHKIRNNPVSSYLETIPNKKLLGFKISTNYNDNIYKSLRLDNKSSMINISNIKKVLYNFSTDYIEHELDFYSKYGDSKLENFYEKLNKINKKDEPLIKIGSGAGFLATTMGLKIKQYDSKLFEEIRRIAHRSYPYEYPKSRKIVKKLHWPLGWAKLKIKNN